MLKAHWWTACSRPTLLVQSCGCHAVSKFIKLARCWCSLITPANKPSLTGTGWTLGIIQHVFNVYIVNMQKTPWYPASQNCFTVAASILFWNLLNKWDADVHSLLLQKYTFPDWCMMNFRNNALYVQCFHSEHAEGTLMNQYTRIPIVHCGGHTVLKFIKLTRCCTVNNFTPISNFLPWLGA